MPAQNPTEVRVLVPAGVLGAGVRSEEIEAGLAMAPHAIAIDAGSTDSGPAYLASGKSKYSPDSIRRDLSLLMEARARAGIPLLIGSCGTSGCDMAVDATLAIALDIAEAQGHPLRIAVLYSEQGKAVIRDSIAAGAVHALSPMGPLDDASVEACLHIVALMGPEPYMAALEQGADIILGGRTTDTAVLSAAPLLHGAPPGPTWHAAKIAECGGVCTVNPSSPGVIINIDADGFTVAPLGAANRCTPHTVSAHMLYENSDPFRLVEPGGVLDVTDADYVAIDDRSVRVSGARWTPAPYTMKLEGAGGGPFQTVMLIGIQDPEVLCDVGGFVGRMKEGLEQRVGRTLGPEAPAFDISLRAYGWNAVTGQPPPPDTPPPLEIGLMFVATAATQELATQIARICNPMFFHFPVRQDKEMPSYAFPFSPAEIERGQVFQFHLNHVVATQDPHELVRTRWIDVKSKSGAAIHA